jgi:hypothetical protein
MESQRDQLVGNRLALVGAVLYFMEWVVIPFAPSLPTDQLGDKPGDIVAAYMHHPGTTAFLAGWLSFVLLGRIAFSAGLRNAFRTSARQLALADWALGAMAVSVVIEIIEYSLDAAGGWLADAQTDVAVIVGLDSAAAMLNHMIYAALGVSVLAGSLAMVQSDLFPRWIGWLGLITGSLLVCGGIVGSAAARTTAGFHDLGGALEGVPVAGFWIWIIAAAVVLFRHAPRRDKEMAKSHAVAPTA